jgi:polar amino acid transport system substrate-binding protein
MQGTGRFGFRTALWLMLATLACAISTHAQQRPAAQLAPNGYLRAALVTSNPLLVSRNLDGKPAGVSVDLANALGSKLGTRVRFVPYDNIVRFNQSIAKNEWDVAFVPRDLTRIAQLAFSDPFMEVDESYVAGPGSALITPEEVDRRGIRVGVAQGSATDDFLSRTLEHAHIVHLTGGFVSATEALSVRRIDVYADYTHIAYLVQAEVAGATVLAEPFTVVRMSIAVPKSNATALSVVNGFIKDANKDGVIAGAITRADLRGVRPGR